MNRDPRQAIYWVLQITLRATRRMPRKHRVWGIVVEILTCSVPASWRCTGLNHNIPFQPGIIMGMLRHPLPLVAPCYAARSRLRSLRQRCVTSLLEKLFVGRPGAHLALPWIRQHHGDKSEGGGLDDIGLADWMYGLRDVAATGAYRASLGECHTVGERGIISCRGNQSVPLCLYVGVCDSCLCV